jgi:apolipoprotein N-acyltransferase
MHHPFPRLLLSILSGILLGLAWNFFPALIFIALVPLLVAENSLKATTGNTFLLSWLCFLIWNVSAGWWVGYASPWGAFLLLTLNSFLPALIFWLYRISAQLLKIRYKWVVLIAFWLSYEFIYQRTEISWPWFNLGNLFGCLPQIIQWYEYTGTLGGSLWILLINVFIAEILWDYKKERRLNTGRLAAILALLLTPTVISVFIYRNYKETPHPVKVSIIQPNIDPYTEKFGRLSTKEQLAIILKEADKCASKDVDYIIAPETAIQGTNREKSLVHNSSVKTIKKFLKNYPKAHFIIGAETNESIDSSPSLKGTPIATEERYNSALQIDSSEKVQIYHKSKLVIGVEKMPFAKYLKSIDMFFIELGGSFGNMTAQDEREVFLSADSRYAIAPIICFESVYGEYVTNYVTAGANLLFIITNDGWWKDSQGTIQHMQLARIRAIETRRSIARSANNGISAAINQRGDILKVLEADRRGGISVSLNTNDEITFYTAYGDYPGKYASLLSALILSFVLYKKYLLKKTTL